MNGRGPGEDSGSRFRVWEEIQRRRQMPRYDYRCTHCGSTVTLRRPVSEFDDPVECLMDGATMDFQFSASAAIHIPGSFKAVKRDGSEGGGQLSWSDFHSHSERELAHIKELDGRPVEIVPTQEYLSRATYESPDASKHAEVSKSVDKAYDEAYKRHHHIDTRS